MINNPPSRTEGMDRAEAQVCESGFTLVELMTVMILMMLILTASLVSWNNLKRGAEMRTAINDIRSSLALARQYAVLKKTVITIGITSGQEYYISNSASATLMRGGGIQELPLGVRFGYTPTPSPAAPVTIVFRRDGSAQENYTVILEDILGNNSRTVQVNGLTGIIDNE